MARRSAMVASAAARMSDVIRSRSSSGIPGGPNKPTKVLVSTEGFQRSTWGGNPSESYDTTRAGSIGSSSGSAVSVSTNLVMCGLCEETRGSCRGPANHNSVAVILPQKSMITFDGGAIGSDIYNDRAGIHCRSIVDSAKVLDALKDPVVMELFDLPHSELLRESDLEAAIISKLPDSGNKLLVC